MLLACDLSTTAKPPSWSPESRAISSPSGYRRACRGWPRPPQVAFAVAAQCGKISSSPARAEGSSAALEKKHLLGVEGGSGVESSGNRHPFDGAAPSPARAPRTSMPRGGRGHRDSRTLTPSSRAVRRVGLASAACRSCIRGEQALVSHRNQNPSSRCPGPDGGSNGQGFVVAPAGTHTPDSPARPAPRKIPSSIQDNDPRRLRPRLLAHGGNCLPVEYDNGRAGVAQLRGKIWADETTSLRMRRCHGGSRTSGFLGSPEGGGRRLSQPRCFSAPSEGRSAARQEAC